MAKPASLPRWATGGTAQVVEPTEGKKDVAWAPLEKPPAQYFNWLLKTIYLWCAYLDGLTNEALTWASKHTFSAGLSSDVAPVAYADVARKYEVDAEAGARAAADALRPLDTAVVHNTGDETIAGVKTFGSPPVVPAPVADGHAANKAYVDVAPFPALSPIAPGANWTANATAGDEPRRWKDRTGVIHLRGEMVSTNGTGGLLAQTGTLPAGSRPLSLRRFPAVVYDASASYIVAGFVAVFPDGSMAFTNTGGFVLAAGDRVALDGISFIAEQ